MDHIQHHACLLSLAVLSCLFMTIEGDACGYKACTDTKDGILNVHLVPHTHDDVGWLKTVDQYFYGANNSIYHASVQYILDSTILTLNQNPSRKFIYAEVAFFKRWWAEQSATMKAKVKNLVNQGRLEFAGGGWSQNDEAATHYVAIIDNMAYGLQFLHENFGTCGRPHIAWQIDVFGHSKEQAALFAKMGMDAAFFARIEDVDHDLRRVEKKLEGVWHGSQSLGSRGDLFFGIFYDHYSPPPGFCFDAFCDDPVIQDDPDLFDYNVDDRVSEFLEFAKKAANAFQTNHIMMTMGGDFEYENANEWFKNLDKLIKYVNQKEESTKVHALYSTPACYLYALNQANKTWTTKDDDFMPIGEPNSYWTGFYTSRPALKLYAREASKILQTCKQLGALSGVDVNSAFLKDAVSIVQHHDAITGTEKQHVADDYAKRLAMGIQQCQISLSDVISKLMLKTKTAPAPKLEFCNYLNISVCATTQSTDAFSVTAYNTLACEVRDYVRIPVNGTQFTVMGPGNKNIQYQVMEVTSETKRVRRDKGSTTHELIFPITIPSVGFSSYLVTAQTTKQRSKGDGSVPAIHKAENSNDVTIKNDNLMLLFDGGTGLLKSMTNIPDNLTLEVQQSFYWYNSSEGSNPYQFRPLGVKAIPLLNKNVNLTYIQGNIVEEVHQQFTPWLSQVIRLHKDQKHAEFEWTVGPVPDKSGLGMEIITRFETPLKSDKLFYTDANGRQMIQRRRNHRDTYPLPMINLVAANYFPVNSRIYIKDDEAQLTVLTDRSQGGSSLVDGALELMIHRRLLHNSGGGLNEALNETGQYGDGLIVRGKHYVILEKPGKSAKVHRPLGLQVFAKPTLLFSHLVPDWRSKYYTKYSYLNTSLPINGHLLTLEQWGQDKNNVLLRLEHPFEVNEDQTLSKAIKVSLKKLLASVFEISDVQEMTLDGNLPISQSTRLQWNTKTEGQFKEDLRYKTTSYGKQADVTLGPMDIQTFLLSVKPRKP
ncbi:lysosomal alpha-mannosidase-like isoform X2 [Ptychodera flava]|uniref:lysosomal alpha-mannosidase-like isoform X2 n=1 Tax=Ptychodera flava TaxID=63121 RepID=UPI00396A60E6